MTIKITATDKLRYFEIIILKTCWYYRKKNTDVTKEKGKNKSTHQTLSSISPYGTIVLSVCLR